jgi:hypothetical protein
MANSETPAPSSLPDLKDADLARILMGTASEVCQCLGVTAKFDLQIVDTNARTPDKLVKAIKRLTMTLTHVVARENLSAEYIASMYQNQPKNEGSEDEASS